MIALVLSMWLAVFVLHAVQVMADVRDASMRRIGRRL